MQVDWLWLKVRKGVPQGSVDAEMTGLGARAPVEYPGIRDSDPPLFRV